MNNLEAPTYIKQALTDFIAFFPHTRVSYEYDSGACVHCIEVVPNKTYHLDTDYIDWENRFTDSFTEMFPNQNVCFFSDDAIVGIKNTQFVLTGNRFVDLISTNYGFSSINAEIILIFSNLNNLNFEKISSTNDVFNNCIANQIKNSKTITEQVNSLSKIEYQNQDLFSTNYSMAS